MQKIVVLIAGLMLLVRTSYVSAMDEYTLRLHLGPHDMVGKEIKVDFRRMMHTGKWSDNVSQETISNVKDFYENLLDAIINKRKFNPLRIVPDKKDEKEGYGPLFLLYQRRWVYGSKKFYHSDNFHNAKLVIELPLNKELSYKKVGKAIKDMLHATAKFKHICDSFSSLKQSTVECIDMLFVLKNKQYTLNMYGPFNKYSLLKKFTILHLDE